MIHWLLFVCIFQPESYAFILWEFKLKHRSWGSHKQLLKFHPSQPQKAFYLFKYLNEINFWCRNQIKVCTFYEANEWRRQNSRREKFQAEHSYWIENRLNAASTYALVSFLLSSDGSEPIIYQKQLAVRQIHVNRWLTSIDLTYWVDKWDFASENNINL